MTPEEELAHLRSEIARIQERAIENYEQLRRSIAPLEAENAKLKREIEMLTSGL
jgi:cell division protein FtsB